jgi:hypothetical protein
VIFQVAKIHPARFEVDALLILPDIFSEKFPDNSQAFIPSLYSL